MKYNKDQIHEIVEVFYQNPFKTFYVNSEDGTKFVKPIGVFVSLGMTTSMNTIENIKDILNNYNDLTAELAEISSKKVTSQYLNTVVDHGDTVRQYEILDVPQKCYNREESLEHFKDYPEQTWKSLFDRIEISDDGWSKNYLQELPDGSIRIFHRTVNYTKDPSDEIEYRIGIYVTSD